MTSRCTVAVGENDEECGMPLPCPDHDSENDRAALKEHDMTPKIKFIVENTEYHAEDWWGAAQDSACPEALRPLVTCETASVAVLESEVPRILVWASELPGWADGPEHAPRALIVRDETAAEREERLARTRVAAQEAESLLRRARVGARA